MVRLLEIVWLILFLPAFCLWFRRPSCLRFVRFFTVTVCGLILLYPFVSASDDLVAVAQEFEEPPASKWIIKSQCGGLVHQTHSVCVIAFSLVEISLSPRVCVQTIADQRQPSATALGAFSGRSPPFRA